MRSPRTSTYVTLATLLSSSAMTVGCLEDDPPPDFGEGGEGGEGATGGTGATGNTGNLGGVGNEGGVGNVGGDPCAGGCDDGNPCTQDTCNPAAGCESVAVADGSTCTDNDLCNGTETCQSGTCSAGTALDCDDENGCTTDTCVAATGCSNEVDLGATCDDGLVCTDLDQCIADGSCAGTPDDTLCDDGDACTADSCDATLGCSNVDESALCDDGDACNGVEACDADTGCAAPGLVGALEDFETGAAGWTTGILMAGGPMSWVLQNGSGGTTPVTFGSLAYGNINQGDLAGEEVSFLQSPLFDLTGGGSLSFQTFVSNEDPSFDLERLDVSYDGGTTWQTLIDSDADVWCSIEAWVPVSATIDPADGTDETMFRFVYDTGDDCCGPDDVIGWFVDNFAIRPIGSLDCDDADPCTVDVCVAGACVNQGEPACQEPFFCGGSGS